MRPLEFYEGREQTYAKHLFLEKYLDRVAWIILSFSDEFTYVDGFSGPWQSGDERFQDTSFAIALNQLRKVRNGYKARGTDPKIRCLFNDNDPVAYQNLERFMDTIKNIEVKTVCQDFEELIPDIVKYVGRSFSLTFIDPTGWSGFDLRKIEKLLLMRGEVIINFMFDDVNRHLSDPRPEITSTFDPLFGGPGWYDEILKEVDRGQTRENAIVSVYRERLRKFGKYLHVTSTRILKPTSDRAYFYLFYGTRNLKGLIEFRRVEKSAIDEQERARDVAKLNRKEQQTGQSDLFAEGEVPTGPRFSDIERRRQLAAASAELRLLLQSQQTIEYNAILGRLLERPMVWESDVKSWLHEMRSRGEIDIPELTGRARVPKFGESRTVVWKNLTT